MVYNLFIKNKIMMTESANQSPCIVYTTDKSLLIYVYIMYCTEYNMYKLIYMSS
jgi:hypothetical protein